MTDPRVAERARAAGAHEAAQTVKGFCEAMPAPERAEDFGAFFDRFADAKVVLLGEATHGTSEFYRARAAITRRLIERHGFTIVAVEADWPDAARIDRYVRHRARPRLARRRVPALSDLDVAQRRGGATSSIGCAAHNDGAAARAARRLLRLDIYSLRGSIAAVLDYLDQVDPEAAQAARSRYGCLTPWQPTRRATAAPCCTARRSRATQALLDQLQICSTSGSTICRRGRRGFFDAAQNARARARGRALLPDHVLRRDRVAGTCATGTCSRRCKPPRPARRRRQGGGLGAQLAYRRRRRDRDGLAGRAQHRPTLPHAPIGDEAVLIGFGTHRGTVAAADDWDAPMEIKTVRPARADSYERLFHDAGIARFLLDLARPGDAAPCASVLPSRGSSAPSASIYRPETELYSHYFEAVLPSSSTPTSGSTRPAAVTPLEADATARRTCPRPIRSGFEQLHSARRRAGAA